MTEAVATRLAAIPATVALGWIAARAGWLGRSGQGRDTTAAEVLGQAAFYLFVPALLFRTMVRLDLATQMCIRDIPEGGLCEAHQARLRQHQGVGPLRHHPDAAGPQVADRDRAEGCLLYTSRCV